MAFLVLSHVSKAFGQTHAVKDFNLEVEKGEFISFLGPSRCGKTTTLRMIAGFEQPTEGQILLEGEDITFARPISEMSGWSSSPMPFFPT